MSHTATLIGIDISKYSFEPWGTNERGEQTLHKRLHRGKFILFFSNFPLHCRHGGVLGFATLGPPAQRVRP